MTKKFYPVANPVTQGFEFVLGGSWSIAIPGPSGIFQRIKYNPDTINKILDFVVTKGPGTQGGKGIKYGLPDTAIYGVRVGQGESPGLRRLLLTGLEAKARNVAPIRPAGPPRQEPTMPRTEIRTDSTTRGAA